MSAARRTRWFESANALAQAAENVQPRLFGGVVELHGHRRRGDLAGLQRG